MKTVPYALAIGSLMYAQISTHPEIAFIVGILGRYLSDSGLSHWRATKKVIKYHQGTKELMRHDEKLDSTYAQGHTQDKAKHLWDTKNTP